MAWKQKKAINKFNNWDDIQTKLGAINGIEDLEEWLNPSKKSLHSPYLLENIQALTDRIVKAIENNEVIGIFYDHDC